MIRVLSGFALVIHIREIGNRIIHVCRWEGNFESREAGRGCRRTCIIKFSLTRSPLEGGPRVSLVNEPARRVRKRARRGVQGVRCWHAVDD